MRGGKGVPVGCKARVAGAGGESVPPPRPDPATHTDGCVFYKGGNICPSASKGGWRVWVDRNNVARDGVVRYGDDLDVSWAAALYRIDVGK